MKTEIRFLKLILLLISCALLFSSCIGLENVEKVKFNILVEEEDGPKEGYLFLQIVPKGEDKFQGTINFKLGDEELSNTFTTGKDDLQNVLTSMIFSNPSLASILGAASSAQLMLTLITMGGELEVGSTMKEKDEEGKETEISIVSSEIRFDKEALWVDMKTDGVVVIQMLAEKETYFPFVLDIKDKELLEPEQQRIHLEAEEIIWQK
ncbi:MAG: hypothetical protein PWP57_471 [Candidatus Atribacteria bacterium]|nr:hypothetical protein [Candidatus Atribacteria bacterium]